MGIQERFGRSAPGVPIVVLLMLLFTMGGLGASSAWAIDCGFPSDTTIVLCGPGNLMLPLPPDATCEIIAGRGTLVDGYWTYYVDHVIRVCVIIRCTDQAGVVCTDTFCVTSRIGDPPVCQAPEDMTITQCEPTTVVIPLPPTNLQCEVVGGPGEIVNGAWVYTPTGTGPVMVTIRCTDECGGYCEDNFTVTFEINEPPVCEIPPTGPPIPECGPSLVVMPITTTDPDGDDTYCEIISGPGELNDGVWSYMPIGGETIAVVIRCFDIPCGNYCEVSFEATFPQLQPPICIFPNDTIITGCELTELRLPVITNCVCEITSGPGELIDGYWVYTPAEAEQVCVTIACIDECEQTCEGSFCVTFEGSAPPEITCPPDVIEPGCKDYVKVCIPITDPDGDPLVITITEITLDGVPTTPSHAPGFGCDHCFTWKLDDRPGLWCFTLTASDECNESECTFCVRIPEGPEEYCTLTQGFYGNCGGEFNDERTIDLLRRLITPAEPLVIGKPGRSLTIPDGAEGCIIERLPAAGTAAPLPVGFGNPVMNHSSCQTSPSLPLSWNGTIRNVFIGQVIALSLNVRLDPDLEELGICHVMQTRRPYSFWPGTYYIPHAVLNALTSAGLDQDVEGLLELANRALAGVNTGVAIYKINDAVDAINRAFDECRILIYCGHSLPYFAKEAGTEELTAAAEPFGLQPNVPNPFNAETQISFSLAENGTVDLSVFNVLGQRVTTLRSGPVEAGTYTVVWDGRDHNGSPVASGFYFCRLAVSGHSATQKMLLLK